jgi:hypothetical protein
MCKGENCRITHTIVMSPINSKQNLEKQVASFLIPKSKQQIKLNQTPINTSNLAKEHKSEFIKSKMFK